MNFIDGWLNRKFKQARIEKFLKEKELNYNNKIITTVKNKKNGVSK